MYFSLLPAVKKTSSLVGIKNNFGPSYFLRTLEYSHLSNNRGGWNKQEGCAKFPELINEEEGITEEGWTFLENVEGVSTST